MSARDKSFLAPAIFGLIVASAGLGAWIVTPSAEPYPNCLEVLASERRTSERQPNRRAQANDLVLIPGPIQRMISNPPPCHGEDNEKRDLAAQEAAAGWAFWVVILSVGQLVISGAGLWALLRTIDQGRKGLERAAEANAIALESARRDLRAYVAQDGVTWLAYRQEGSEAVTHWGARVGWLNAGATPTRHLRLQVWWYSENHDIPQDYQFDYADPDPGPSSLIPPGKHLMSNDVNLPAFHIQEVRNGVRFLYLWGWAKYGDVLANSPEYVTRFCYRVYVNSGNPLQLVSDTNIVNFSTSLHRRHNCSDEECPTLP